MGWCLVVGGGVPSVSKLLAECWRAGVWLLALTTVWLIALPTVEVWRGPIVSDEDSLVGGFGRAYYLAT